MTIIRRIHPVVPKLFFLCLLGLALYAQTLDDPFHFDDFVTIVENRAVHLLPDVQATVRGLLDFQPSRFVTNLTFAANYYFNRLGTSGYHAVNIGVHLATAGLVWWFGILLAGSSINERHKPASQKHPKKERQGILGRSDGYLPFLAALIFLAHPVNTQAVSYLSQRSESLAAMFYLLSVCCYIKGRRDQTHSRSFYVLCAISGLLASFCKETAVTLPLMFIAIEMFFSKAFPAVVSRRLVFAVFVVVFVLLIPASFQFHYFEMLTRSYPSQSHLGDMLTLPTYVMTQVRVFVTYLRLMFFPVGLNLDHDYPMTQSLFEPSFLGSLLVWIAIGVSAYAARKKHPLVTFAAVWFFLSLSSNLVPRAHVIFEHKLYLALAGTLPALVLGASTLLRDSKALIIGCWLIIVIFSVLTYQRNQVWGSDTALWEDVLKSSPGKARAQLSLGAAYAAQGQYEQALKAFSDVIATTAEPYRAYSNRGAVYVKTGRLDLAMDDFNRAIASGPQFADAYLNRGELLAQRKEFASAIDDFEHVLKADPNYAPAYRMRGRVFDALHQYDKAMEDYNMAIRIDPGDAQAFAWRGYLKALKGDMEGAFADFNAALRLDGNFSDAYVYRGMYYKDRHEFPQALSDFDKAIELKPESSLAYYQRASAYFDWGKLAEAFRDAQAAIAKDEGFDLPYSLRGIIFARRGEYASALNDFNRAAALDPNSSAHRINRDKILRILQKTSPTPGVDMVTGR